MGKITKVIQAKHKETLTPWLQEFVDSATSKPLPLLPEVLATFPSRWPFPRGDLYHWIPLLNRFDEVLESFNTTYKLSEGPQSRDFRCEVLSRSVAELEGVEQCRNLTELGYSQDGDVSLIESILKFTQMLLDHCGNRSIYASSAHLNDLLNSTDYRILCATLQVGVELAQRYQASVKRIHGMATRQVHTALLSNHYNIDLDRVQQLAQPFVKTPIVKPSDSGTVSTPSIAGKSKEKPVGGSSKNVATMFANDLCAIAKPEPNQAHGTQTRWSGWADLKLTYYPSSSTGSHEHSQPSTPDRAVPNAPSTPTPLRRSNSANASQITPRATRQAQGLSEDSPSSTSRSPLSRDESISPGQKFLEVPQSMVVTSSPYHVLGKLPKDLPKETRYEFLNRLRVAKALTGSTETRQQALKARLLAIQNLAYIHVESIFVEKVLRQDSDEPRRFQLVYQLAELIHPGANGTAQVPLDLQSIALSLLEAISSFHSKLPDVFSALNATVNHGVLLYVIRKAVAEMKEDDAGDQWTLKDAWRDNLFSLTLHITMAMANTSIRSTPEIISAGLLDILVEILNLRSSIAERTHGTLVGFLDSLVYNVTSSFQSLAAADGLEAITNLITHEVELAKKLVADGRGTPSSHRSQVVDYEIPFYQQQNLKFLLKLIHHLMTNAFAFGGNTDRLLRNLVDKSDLLRSIREIIENVKRFGALVWTNAVTILGDFLNNDPTSFSAVFEAGLIHSYLVALTGRPVTTTQGEDAVAPSPEHTNDEDHGSPGSSLISDALEPDTRPHPPPPEVLQRARDHSLAGGILASADPISTVPAVLNAICLNNLGMKMVVSSQAFDSFFEIFESPDHVRVLAADMVLPNSVGSSFDELARHHPSLRPAIANAVLDMIARVTHLARTKAQDCNWGAKLVVRDSEQRELVADESLTGYTTDGAKPRNVVGDADVHMTDIDAEDADDSEKSSGPLSVHTSIVPYVNAVAGFLSHYISNQNLKSNLITNGGIERLLDLYTSPSLPHSSRGSFAARGLQNVLSSLIEFSPIIGLPSLLRRTQDAINVLDIIVKSEDSASYFKPFLTDDSILDGHTHPNLVTHLATGTSVVKALLNAQSLMRVLYHSFPFSSRTQTVTLHAINVFDYHSQLIRSLGPLIRAMVLEQIAVSTIVPQQWYGKENEGHDQQTSPATSPKTSSDSGFDFENLAFSDAFSAAAVWKWATGKKTTSNQEFPKISLSSPQHRNFQTVKALFETLLPTALPLLQTYGKSLLLKRERDTYIRSHHVRLAEDISVSILQQLRVLSHESTAQDFLYWYTMLHTVHELLVNPTAEGHPDRTMHAQNIIPVLLAFKKHGGLKLLNSMLIKFKDEVCNSHESDDEMARSKLASLGLKKILDIYGMLANGKLISEAVAGVNVLPRIATGNDRRNETLVAPNLVVELRATILPVLQELWESSLVEKGSAMAVAKTIEILKSISLADSEANAYKRSDKHPPPAYLKANDVPFPWPTHTQEVKQLTESSYSESLGQEAIYRSFGNHQVASEYCAAHQKEIAGKRNPIPEIDAPKEVGGESPAERSVPVEDEAMAIDLPADLPSGILDEELMLPDELPENTTLSSGTDRDTPIPSTMQQESNDNRSISTSPVQGSIAGARLETENNTQPSHVAKEDLDEERAKLRSNLIDRCLDVIGAHPDNTYEVSELISSVISRSPGEDLSIKQDIGETLVHSLLSFLTGDDLKANGRSIAAYAHLLSLLLQDKSFLSATIRFLKENVSEFLRFLGVSGSSSDELSPWIPYVLLIFEILLSDDEQLGDINWKAPDQENDSIRPLEWSTKDLNVKDDDRRTLLNSILEILPRIGKEESLAVSVLRILVILTRDRTVARQVGDKKNLQRLFVTAKQLSGVGALRLSETRISSYILTILRHVIEDEEVMKQIMRSEIRTYMDSGRNSRPLDPGAFLKQFSSLVLRDPKLFVEVCNEILKLNRSTSRGEGTNSRPQIILLKEPSEEATRDEVAPAVRATEDLSIQDIKPSTESGDKHIDDTPKTATQDLKRPVVETPDGVVHFLLCELLNYKEVEDKDASQLSKEGTQSREQNPSSDVLSEGDSSTADGKEKKGKSPFKTDEHPIFIYRCFLLHCLTELLQSYNRTKVEFINFKRNAPLFANTPVKPRSSVLNYLLTDLLYPSHIDGPLDTIIYKKKYATAMQTQNLLVALVSRTGEKPVDRGRDKYDYEDEPDLLFVRRFVLDTILKCYKDATTSNDPFDSRYARMLGLAEVMHLMMGDKDKESSGSSRNNFDPLERSQSQLRRLMYEKGYLAALTASIADIDLAFPPVKRTIKYILRVFRVLTSTAINLSHSNIISSVPTYDSVEDELISASSLSDIEDDREETPDLYRNSALGMHEPGREMDDDYSEDSEDDDDEEMYDDEYDDDMAYESEDREEDVSDRDEEHLEGMGPIEGLSGEPGVIEVTMEDDDVDEMDEDDDEDESDEDGDSDEMDEVEDHIEIIDDEGNPLNDEGASDWESEPDDVADEEAEIDYEAGAQDLQEAEIHALDDGLHPFGNLMRAIGGDGDFEPIVEDINHLNDRYMEEEDDDEEDEEDEDMDDEYAYEEEYPNDPPPRDIVAPSLGWDTLVVDHGSMFGGRRRHQPIDRQPVSLPFMVGQRGLDNFTDARIRSGHSRDARMPANEDGINPLLRRANENGQDGSPRPVNYAGGSLVRLGLPGSFFTGAGHDNPMAFINDLVASLPVQLGRHGHSLHFSIGGGPRGPMNDISFPFSIPSRETRSDSRRDPFQEPVHSTSFSAESTIIRWTEEMKMIFGSGYQGEAGRLLPAILSHLVPPAIREERRLQAERQRIEDGQRKQREEEERKAKEAREAKEAEEKAAREQKEAEERERAAEAAAVAAAAAAAEAQASSSNEDLDTHSTESDAMEGIEPSGEIAGAAREHTSTTSQTRSFTTIRGEQVDITELGIDLDYLEALPEEFREEVIAQTVSSRRAEAREAPRGAGEQTEIFQEFLDALPEEIREEIVRQESIERRRRDREEVRRQATAAGQAPEAQDMDPASILMTFPPELRDQVLMDQGPEILDSLPPDLAAQARRVLRTTHHVAPEDRNPSGVNRGRDTIQPSGPTDEDNKPQRRAVVQMLDKPGVATLLRLMFINMKGGSIENSLRNVFKDVCENRQNRLEVISTLLQILQDGSTDVDAVERSFTHLSIKAKPPKDKETKTQTPQGLKRASTNISSHHSMQTTSETSPLLIVQQCLDLLCYLADQNVHIPSLFLTEHDVAISTLKRSLSRKGKTKDNKAQKYAINSLLCLLDRDIVMESSAIMDSLSQLLSRVTFPLLTLDRKQKEAAEAIKLLEAENPNTDDEPTVAVNHEIAIANNTHETTLEDADPTTASGIQPSDRVPIMVENPESSGPLSLSNIEPKTLTALEKKQAVLKKIKQLHPPVIPDTNLTLIIKIFVARECSSKTFKETLSTIKNLSVIPGAMLVFGHELARQAQVLSEKIVIHLNELLPHIQSADTGTEIQGVALSKFSPGASDQNKLLRVLTALDHLFAQKKSDMAGGSSAEETKKQDLLSTLYHNTTFNALWEKLSACLSAIRQRESLLNVATILLPLIEALMVVCKDSAQVDAGISTGQTPKDMVLSSPQPESRMAGLFFTFTEDHRRILNELVRNNPSLMKGTFSHLVKNPKVLEFDNKRNWFNRSVHNKQQGTHRPFPTLQLQVRREHVFHDSFKSLYFKSGEEMKFSKLNIRFHGEEGVDAGGVTREWFQVLARQMFDANYALFVPVSSDRTTFHPNKLSGINDEHLLFFKFIGRIIGKALYEGRLLDCYFSRAVYKRILGKPVSVKDMESFDPEYYKSLSWMLNNDITDIITETFSVEDDEFGVTKVSDLCENGRNIPVTEENKHDYVRLVVEHKLLSSVKDQMEHFLKGFHDIIPAELISIFNEQELELLISGLPDVDIDDWKSNTEYHNYTPSSPQIQWFWRALRSFDKEEVAKLLQFVTGTSKVPLNGFKELEGMNGINRFNIHRDYGNKDRLPSSHTCFNQLDLPEYETYEMLRRQLLKAITAGSDYFGFA
ncbi:putative E3 ubiquitin-protein ligase HUWE1 [Rosellinia necatrix]|uniref:HECT-type E3 ubiquitin transferase n=1 Tax=Rosellinia necatrix TaxID=77044 RepID=A0A1S7UKH9_ROSNE|nr:putative E3 ubiquitin-protein ligase HUWE1 [Rosellinia necatrix]